MTTKKTTADFIFFHPQGKKHILTMDPFRPYASWMAIKHGRIVHLGDGCPRDFSPWKGTQTQVISCEKYFLMPAFIESHAHLSNLGRRQHLLNLERMTDEEDIHHLLLSFQSTHPAPEWILGRGWDQNKWSQIHLPHHRSLDKLTPHQGVYLIRIDGHAAWVNQYALKKAGIDEKTPDPSGGKIERDAQGYPTGVLIDRAMELVEKCLPVKTEEDEERFLKTGIEECLRKGVVTFHDACTSLLQKKICEKWVEQNTFPIRLYTMMDSLEAKAIDHLFSTGPKRYGRDDLMMKAVKLYADGALGSCGAYLQEPYIQQAHRGLLLLEEQEIYDWSTRCGERGIQVCTHAIGDHTNHITLNAYQRASLSSQHTLPRPRIEHAQVISPQDLPRFSQLGVIASIQSTHCTSDKPWIEDRLGNQRAKERSSPWRSLSHYGTILANGSDAPIEILGPLQGIFAACTRRDPEKILRDQKDDPWNPEQCLNRWEALESFTIKGAYAAFLEQQTGSLELGKWADLVILDQDLLQVSIEKLLHTKIQATMKAGMFQYCSPSFSHG